MKRENCLVKSIERNALLITTLLIDAFSAGCSSDKATERSADGDSYNEDDSGWDYDDFHNGNSGPVSDVTEVNGIQYHPSSADVACDTVNDTRFTLYPQNANSTAGPVIARALINDSEWVTIPIRTSEFLSYYSPASLFDSSTDLSVSAGISAVHESDEEPLYNLYVALSAKPIDDSTRRAINLALLVDTTISMENSVDLTKSIARKIVAELTEKDTIAITTFNTQQPVVLSPAVPGSEKINEAIQRLAVSEETDFAVGLDSAYRVLAENVAPEKDQSHHIALISNGEFEIGITHNDAITEAAEDDQLPIRLSAIGVSDSPATYNASLMKNVSEAGLGVHVFVDTSTEIRRLFGNNLAAMTELAAKSVDISLTMPPAFEVVEAPPNDTEHNVDKDIRQWPLSTDRVMIMRHQATVCDDAATASVKNIIVSASYDDAKTQTSETRNFSVPLQSLLETEDEALTKIEAVASYAETLKAVKVLTASQSLSRIDTTLEMVADALEVIPGDSDLEEIQTLLDTYREMFE